MRREPDLAWYYEEARLTLGAPAASIESSTRSEGKVPDGLPRYVVIAAAKYRDIDRVVRRLSYEQQRVLRAFYSPMLPAARRMFADLGDLAPVALHLKGDAAALASMVVRARKDRNVSARLGELRDEAKAALADAHRAYRDARKSLGRENLAAYVAWLCGT